MFDWLKRSAAAVILLFLLFILFRFFCLCYSELGADHVTKTSPTGSGVFGDFKKSSSGSGSLRKQNSAAEISSIRHYNPLPVWQEMVEFSLVSKNQQVWTGTNVHRYSRWHVLPGCEEEDAADGKVGQQHEEPNGWRERVQEGEVSWFTALKHTDRPKVNIMVSSIRSGFCCWLPVNPFHVNMKDVKVCVERMQHVDVWSASQSSFRRAHGRDVLVQLFHLGRCKVREAVHRGRRVLSITAHKRSVKCALALSVLAFPCRHVNGQKMCFVCFRLSRLQI